MSYLRDRENYEPISNWDQEQAPAINGTQNVTSKIQEYRHQANERVGTFDNLIGEFTRSVGLPLIAVPACIKSQDSAERKVWDRTTRVENFGHPEKITDYLRAKILVPQDSDTRITNRNLIKVIRALAEHPDTVAYKDQFFRPEKETGYRSFKAIMNVDGHKSELIVYNAGMEKPYRATDALRNYERRLRQYEATHSQRHAFDAIDARQTNRLMTNAEITIERIRNMRKAVHDYHAGQFNLNELRGTFEGHAEVTTKPDLMRVFREAAETPIFGRAIMPILSRFSIAGPEARVA